MLQQSSNEFQLLLKALGYVKTHWWLLLLEVMLIYGYSLQRYYAATPEYRSSASILIDDSRRRMYQSFMGANRLMNVRKQNVSQLLSSEEVMERFRTALTEMNDREARPTHLQKYFPSGVALPSGAFRGQINLTWDEKSDNFTITCSADNPDAARDLCLAYMDTVEKYYPEIGQRDALMKREFLNRQLASVSRQIADAEIRLVEMQKEAPDFFDYLVLDSDDSGRRRLQGVLVDLNEKIATNRATRQVLFKVPHAKRGEHTELMITIDALTTQLSDLQYRLKLTEQSEDPEKEERLVLIKKEIEVTAARLGRLNESVIKAFVANPLTAKDLRTKVADLEMEYQGYQIKKTHIVEQLEDLNVKERKYTDLKLQYKRLRSELDHKRRLLNNLYKLEQETELALSAGNSDIYRLREPSRMPVPVAPQLARYLYGSLSVCLFVLVISIILLMALFPRLDSEAEVNRLNLPVIGKVPHFRQGATRLDDIPSYAIEYLKIMNYRLLRETKDVKCPVVIVTSAHAREGKSTIINSLTLTSQSPTRKTLLIDGDLLTNRPNEFFGIKEHQTVGLRSLLTNPNAEGIDELIVRTSEPGLSFLPRGERIDLTATPHVIKPMEQIVKRLRNEYDMIFIDTPPMFASNLSHQWAGLADLIVIVARIYVTRPRDIIEAIQTAKVYSKAPVGIALNCVPLSGAYRRASNYYFSKKKTRVDRLAA